MFDYFRLVCSLKFKYGFRILNNFSQPCEHMNSFLEGTIFLFRFGRVYQITLLLKIRFTAKFSNLVSLIILLISKAPFHHTLVHIVSPRSSVSVDFILRSGYFCCWRFYFSFIPPSPNGLMFSSLNSFWLFLMVKSKLPPTVLTSVVDKHWGISFFRLSALFSVLYGQH